MHTHTASGRMMVVAVAMTKENDADNDDDDDEEENSPLLILRKVFRYIVLLPIHSLSIHFFIPFSLSLIHSSSNIYQSFLFSLVIQYIRDQVSAYAHKHKLYSVRRHRLCTRQHF